MSAMHDSLRRCFRTVFSGLTEDQIEQASLERTAGWDSAASVDLIAVIEDELQITIPPEDYGDLTSFHAIHEYLMERQHS